MQRPFRPADQPMLPGSGVQSGSLLRRLREDPHDAIVRIAGEIGVRRATSLGEAQAAAYIDGRMRRAGMRVSVDAFRAPVGLAWDGLLIGLAALVGVVLYRWLPLPSLFLALWNVGLAAVMLWRPAAPLLRRRRPSQNVIATRALNSSPRWRVVLLAALDAPPASGRLTRLLATGQRPLFARLLASGLIALLGFGALFGPIELRRLLWYVQFLPTGYLLLLCAFELRLAFAPATPGAVNHAGALAALLHSADMLGGLQQTELWAVALGSSDSGAGLDDLLRRYPFDRDQTLFVGIESLGGGRLSYVTRAGALLRQPADPELLHLVAAADASDTLINAEPRPYASEPVLAHALGRAGRRAITIIGLDADGRPAQRGSLADSPDFVDAAALDRGIRLIVELVKRVDESA